jgi:hypothetical protein
MKRQVIFSTDDVIVRIEQALYPYIGVAAQVADHQPLIIALLESFCFGHYHDEIQRMLESYPLPTLVIEQVKQQITSEVYGLITQGLQYVIPGKSYDYQFIDEDVFMTESDRNYPIDDDTCWLDHSTDDSDYVPERLRYSKG